MWEEEGLTPSRSRAPTELDPFPRGQAFQFEAQRPAIAARGLAEAENELAGFVRSGNRVVVTFPHRGEALRQGGLLRKVESTIHEDGAPLPREPAVRFAVSPARRGFVWRELGLVLLPDTQVFRKRPPRADARLGRALASFADLRVGDYVVHEDHGVGKLLGFETKAVAGVTRDYLFLAFRGEDRLYVPHEQLGKLSRYIGADAKAPALSKLGGKAWQNLKTRARESVRELAGELLALYAQRQRAEGASFDLSNEWLERLEASFPYRETDDQARAIEAVKEDLESTRPMDRLVCGDVGFGKTEVAVRAAFAVAVNSRQVLVLCPTTILAEQHWNTFRERFRDFPLNVEMVSRFRKPAETKQVLADFAAGKVDVLVGTHRVLSRDVIPKELGLVILDEEQRFGVAQKELLRSLRLEVDVLALSATPIPRTLHMSLSGLRDISIIETPPEGRRPIRTSVGEYDEDADQGRRSSGSTPAAVRRSTSTTASRRSRRWARSSASSARGCASSSRTGRWASASSRSGCTPSSPATPTCSSRPRSSSRASTSRRPTRSSWSAPTCSASASSTRSAGASAAPTSRPTRTSSTRTRAS